jgi:hypothetical protein
VILWDLTAIPELAKVKPPKWPDLEPPKPAPEKALPAEELTQLWDDLAGADAVKASKAMWRLADHPKSSLPLLRDRLKPVTAPKAEVLAAVLKDLNDDDQGTRTRASAALVEFGTVVVPDLKKALKESPPAEVKNRLENALKALRPPYKGGPTLSRLRGIEALEHAGTDEARALLKELAGGASAAVETQAARQSLDRLDKADASRK